MGKSNLSCLWNIKNRAALDRLCRVTFKGLRHFVWLVVIEFKHQKAKQVSENHLIFLITLYIATNKNVQNVCLKRVILYETHCTGARLGGYWTHRSERSVREGECNEKKWPEVSSLNCTSSSLIGIIYLLWMLHLIKCQCQVSVACLAGFLWKVFLHFYFKGTTALKCFAAFQFC